MNNGLQVDSAVLAESANSLRTDVNKMRDVHERATTIIDRTTQSWQSNAAKDLRDQYAFFAKTYDDFYAAIEEYAKFLDKVAREYEEFDQTKSQQSKEVLNSGYTGSNMG